MGKILGGVRGGGGVKINFSVMLMSLYGFDCVFHLDINSYNRFLLEIRNQNLVIKFLTSVIK